MNMPNSPTTNISESITPIYSLWGGHKLPAKNLGGHLCFHDAKEAAWHWAAGRSEVPYRRFEIKSVLSGKVRLIGRAYVIFGYPIMTWRKP